MNKMTSVLTALMVSTISSSALAADFMASGGSSINFGFSTNPTQIELERSSSFFDLNPSINTKLKLDPSLSLVTKAKGNFLVHLEDEVGNVANSYSTNARTYALWKVSRAFRLRPFAQISFSSNEDPYVGTQTYFQPRFKLQARYRVKPFTLSLEPFVSIKDFTTRTLDIRGNAYEESSDQFGAKASVAVKASRALKLSLEGTFRRTSYTQRMAEFTDGSPVFGGVTHPFLVVNTFETELESKLNQGPFRLAISPFIGAKDDRVFGARDSSYYGAKVEARYILGAFELNSNTRLKWTDYDDFTVDPINATESSELRSDLDLATSLQVLWNLNRSVAARVSYRFNQRSTNYIYLDEYQEHAILTGTQLDF